MTARTITKDEIERLLEEISDRLEETGKSGEILLAGGASMALVYDARDTTKDVDAIFSPHDEIRTIAKSIAESNSLDEIYLILDKYTSSLQLTPGIDYFCQAAFYEYQSCRH